MLGVRIPELCERDAAPPAAVVASRLDPGSRGKMPQPPPSYCLSHLEPVSFHFILEFLALFIKQAKFSELSIGLDIV